MTNWTEDPEHPYLLQNLETEFGQLTLERISSDRGSWRFTTDTNPGKHNRVLNLIPLYFFDEEIAKVEIEQWLKVATDFTKSAHHDFAVSPLAEQILHGKFCMVTAGQIVTTPDVFAGYFANVIVPQEIERWMCVDDADQFPRTFIYEESAISEINAWAMRRRQLTEYSKWIKLDP